MFQDDHSNQRTPTCPYCGRNVYWIPNRWFGRGCFQCETCGDFPDFSGTGTTGSAGQEPWLVGTPQPRPKTDNRIRVLLVDDSTEHRDLYAMMLEDYASVTTASRGDDALVTASADPPDAIILDVMMPGIDGWRVCECLRANPATARIPVIMLTSLDTAGMTARAREVGAVAVLMKPCPVERLMLTLHESLRPDPARR